MEGNITITKKEYLSLRLADAKLNLLETGGVDNWDWYGESLWPDPTYGKSENIEQAEDRIKQEIEKM